MFIFYFVKLNKNKVNLILKAKQINQKNKSVKDDIIDKFDYIDFKVANNRENIQIIWITAWKNENLYNEQVIGKFNVNTETFENINKSLEKEIKINISKHSKYKVVEFNYTSKFGLISRWMFVAIKKSKNKQEYYKLIKKWDVIWENFSLSSINGELVADNKMLRIWRWRGNNTTKWSEVLEWTKEKRYALSIVNKNLKTEDREYMNFAYAVARVIQKKIWKKLKKWEKNFNVLKMVDETNVIKQIEELYYTQGTVNNIFEEIAKNTNRYPVKRVDIVYTGVLTNKWKRKLKELLEFLEDERSERNTKWDNISDVIILSKTINPDKDFAKRLKNIDTIQVYKTRDWNKTYLISKLLNNWTIESTKDIIATKYSWYSLEYSWYPLKILERIKNWNEIVVDFVDQQAWVMSSHYIRDIEKVISLIKSLYKERNEVLTVQDVKTIEEFVWVFYSLNEKFIDSYKFDFFDAILEAGRDEKDLDYDKIADIIENTYKEKVGWRKKRVDKLLSPFVLLTKNKLEKNKFKRSTN